MTVALPATSTIVDQAARLRRRLAVGGALGRASIGTVPILWNNVDVAELRLGTAAGTILDDSARTGYDGCQLGLGFPEGEELRAELVHRGLRLAEVYASISGTVDGPSAGALGAVRERLRLLIAGGGEVLCIAFDGSPDRDMTAGCATDPATPRLTDAGRARTVALLETISAETRAAGGRIAFHPHAGTYVETPPRSSAWRHRSRRTCSPSVSTSATTSSAAATRSRPCAGSACGSSTST